MPKTKQNTPDTPEVSQLETCGHVSPNLQSVQDLKHSVLIVSVVINIAILVAWIALQVTSQYDGQLAAFLLTR